MKQSNANSIIKQLEDISAFVKHKSLSSFEEKNILRDLEILNKRAMSGQYKETDFLQRNRFDAGRRTEEFFHYIEGYIEQSKRWERILKPVLAENHITSITDICPGWAPKIELALGHLEFTGTITLFDQDATAMKKLKNFTHYFYPSINLVQHKGDVFSNAKKPHSDLIVANHIIDDLILSLYTKKYRIHLETLYASEKSFIQTTNDICTNQTFLREATNTIIYALHQFVSPTNMLVIRQYPGLTEASIGLTKWIKCIAKITQEISKTMQENNVSIILISN